MSIIGILSVIFITFTLLPAIFRWLVTYKKGLRNRPITFVDFIFFNVGTFRFCHWVDNYVNSIINNGGYPDKKEIQKNIYTSPFQIPDMVYDLQEFCFQKGCNKS